MKYRSTTRLSLPLASALTALMASSYLHASVLTWDNGAATGNWNTTDLNWTGAAAWNNTPPDDAIFAATGIGTVSLTAPISAGSISINNTGYTITGDTLTLSGGLTALTSNVASTVNSNITFVTAAGTITSTSGTLTLGGTVDAGSLALTFAGAGNTAVSNGIVNGTTLTKSGNGTLTLSSANTYSGATTISGGILQAGSTSGLSPNSNISLASGTRLILGGFSNTVGALNGTGGVVENANASPATLTIGNTGASGVYSSNLQDGTGGGALSVIKTGSGTQAITNASFTGGLTINAGTWQLGGVNGLGNGPVIMAAGAKLSSNSATARTLTNVANTIAINGSITLGDATNTGNMTLPGAVTLSSSPTITVASGNNTLSGVVSGTTFTKAGAGRVNLTNAANSYLGGTTISAGTLGVSADGSLGAAGTDITMTGTGAISPGNATFARNITINSVTAFFENAGGGTFTGNVTGTGGIATTSNFGSQVSLNGTGNTFEGPITIGSGGVTGQAYRISFASLADSITVNGKISLTASSVTHANGSVFEYNGASNFVLANRPIEIASTGSTPTNSHQIRRSGNGTLTINKDLSVTAPYAQTIALLGANTTGNNTFAGKLSNNPTAAVGTTVLAAAFANNASTITLASVQGITIGASISGTNIAGGTTVNAINPTTNAVTLSTNTIGAGTVNQVITVTGVTNPLSLRKGDAGTWILTGENTYTGNTTVAAGQLQIGGAGTLGAGDYAGNIAITGGTFTVNSTASQTLSGVISGTGAFQKNNSGVLTLSGTNTHTGTKSIDGGTLSVSTISDSNTSNIGPSGAVSFTNGATLLYTGAGASTTTRNFAVSAGSGVIDVSSLTGSLTISGTFTGDHTRTLTKSGDGTLTLAGAADNVSLILNASDGTVNLGKTSSGTVHSVAGISDIARGATVIIQGSGTDHIFNGGFQANFGLVNMSGGTLDLHGYSETFNILTGIGVVKSSGGPSTLTLGAVDGSGSFDGALTDGTGTLALTKIGTGTTTLTGTNSYSGNTAVNGGSLALADNAQLKFVIGATSGVSNNITGTGTLTIDGDFNIDTTITDATALTSGTWVLVNTSTLTESFSSTFTVVGAGWSETANVWTKTVGNKKYTFTEADGTLVLSSAASYATWIDGFFPSETNPAIIGTDADPDNDGIDNGVEMVIGGNPATGMDLALLPTIELVSADPDGDTTFSDYLLFTYRRTDLSVDADVTADCEIDTDLIAPWTISTEVPGVVVIEDNNFTFTPPVADTDRVRVFVPKGINTKLFGRLYVEVP